MNPISIEVKEIAAKAVPAGKMHLFKKACEHVEAGAARLDSSEVVIDSQSDAGTQYRYGLDEHCTCPAGVTNRWCYHLSCRDLLVVQAMLDEQAPTYEEKAKAQADQDEAYEWYCAEIDSPLPYKPWLKLYQEYCELASKDELTFDRADMNRIVELETLLGI